MKFSIDDSHIKFEVTPKDEKVAILLRGSGDWHEMHEMTYQQAERLFLKLLALMKTMGD
jgi:hypothetical protein